MIPMKRTLKGRVWMLASAALVSGCTHAMEIRNLGAYALQATAPQPLVVGLKDNSDSSQLFGSVHKALAVHPGAKQVVVIPRYKLGDTPEPPRDVTASVRSATAYHGSGWNFWITFPGFLVFTHAWNGFVYSADVTTDLEVVVADGAPVRREVVTKYDLRHCDFGRGAAASSGWYLPGWGGTNILVGLFMMSYDEDATPEFLEKVGNAYGEFIANNIVEMIGSAPAKSARIEPPVCARYEAASGRYRSCDG